MAAEREAYTDDLAYELDVEFDGIDANDLDDSDDSDDTSLPFSKARNGRVSFGEGLPTARWTQPRSI